MATRVADLEAADADSAYGATAWIAKIYQVQAYPPDGHRRERRRGARSPALWVELYLGGEIAAAAEVD